MRVYILLRRYWAVEVKRKEEGGRIRLWVVIFKCIWIQFLIVGFLQFSEVIVSTILFLHDNYDINYDQVALQTGQAIVLGHLGSYFTLDEPTHQDTLNAYLLAAGEV